MLTLSIKLGIPGSQERLVAALMEHGDLSMAEDYLNCGSDYLAEGGRTWAQQHGYTVGSGSGSHRADWGQY